MGLFSVDVTLANPAAPDRMETVSLLVDTGATLSHIPRQVLEGMGVRPTSRLGFLVADGRRFERDVGGVLMSIDGRTLPIPVAFAEQGEQPVLGATALEALGFAVDAVDKKLVPRDLLAL